MPVKIRENIRYLDQTEFGGVAYEVMDRAFSIHKEFGRFCNEDIYERLMLDRLANARTQVMVEVLFRDFRKEYFIDLLVDEGAVFELKTVDRIGPSHRSQLLSYLLLCELSHGKIINFRPERVEHEFVNTHLKRADRTAFQVGDVNWMDPCPNDQSLQRWLVDFLKDLGTGLDVDLYEAVICHLFGGKEIMLHEVEIFSGSKQLGTQRIQMASPTWALKVTMVDESGCKGFERHARRFLNHTKLQGIHWVNITLEKVTFASIKNELSQADGG